MQFVIDHWRHIAAVLGGLGVFAYLFWPTLGKFRIPWGGGTEVAEDTDVADLQALRRLAKRYEPCPEGKAAVHVLYAHFFHEHRPA